MMSQATDNRHRNAAHTAAHTRARTAGIALALSLLSANVPAAVKASASGSATEPLARIRAAVESYIKAQIPSGSGESTIVVGALDSRLRLAHCGSELSAAMPAGALQARVTVAVSCAGPSHWTVYIPATIETRTNVLVLRHAAARDAHLTAADVLIETRTTAGPGTAYLTSAAELNGRTVRRTLAAGTTLGVEMFSPDLIVHRGQQVTLVSSGNALEVRASGRVLADAAAGARVQVQNLSSMRIVEGIVESADLVRVAR